LEINVQEGNVHSVLSIPSKNSVSEAVTLLKGKCTISTLLLNFLFFVTENKFSILKSEC